MYAILYWVNEGYVTFLHNEDGSIRLFETLDTADIYANQLPNSDDVRVISIEGVGGGELTDDDIKALSI